MSIHPTTSRASYRAAQIEQPPRRMRLVWNVAEIIATALVSLVVIAIVVMFVLVAEAQRPDVLPPLDLHYGSSSTVPPGDSLPPCTDAIADAGGMCEGPLIDDAGVGR